MLTYVILNYTTSRYLEKWVLYNSNKTELSIKLSLEGLVKLQEHAWWLGAKLTISLESRNNMPTFVIAEEQAKAAAIKLMLCPYLHEVASILNTGECWVQDLIELTAMAESENQTINSGGNDPHSRVKASKNSSSLSHAATPADATAYSDSS